MAISEPTASEQQGEAEAALVGVQVVADRRDARDPGREQRAVGREHDPGGPDLPAYGEADGRSAPGEPRWSHGVPASGLAWGTGGQERGMDYTHLGRSGLSVSRLCLGTMNFGPETTEEDSHAIMDRALDLGINFFDTANVYGWKKGEGITEQIVGRWFAQGGGRREKTVIATKLYGSMSDWPNDTFLSARNIRRGLRRVAAAAADRLHRPLPDAPRRPRHAVGRDLGGVRRPAHAGQGPLLRLVQPRRLAHREGPGGGAPPRRRSGW